MMQLLSPRDESDLAEAVAKARASRTPLAIKGGGTKESVGHPVQAAATLSLAGLSGVTLYEPAEMVIGAKAGTPLVDIERLLAEKGQRLAFEPMDYRPLLATAGEPTLGGTVAANVSGPRRVAAGACRDSLIGLRFVNGRGEIVKTGGRVMKNVTGLDLVKLCAGSWGTLAVFSEAIFKIVPAPERSDTLVLHGLSDGEAVAAMAKALGSPYEVTGAAHLPAGIDRVAKTLIRVEGFVPSVAYRLGALRDNLPTGGGATALEDEPGAQLWRRIRDADFLAEPRDKAVWRVSVAPSKAVAVLRAVQDAPSLRYFLDWGGGLIWLALDASGDGEAAKIRAATRETGGHATLIRAPVALRAAVPVFEPPSEPVKRLTAGIKTAFDPDAILNPGRIYCGV